MAQKTTVYKRGGGEEEQECQGKARAPSFPE